MDVKWKRPPGYPDPWEYIFTDVSCLYLVITNILVIVVALLNHWNLWIVIFLATTIARIVAAIVVEMIVAVGHGNPN